MSLVLAVASLAIPPMLPLTPYIPKMLNNIPLSIPFLSARPENLASAQWSSFNPAWMQFITAIARYIERNYNEKFLISQEEHSYYQHNRLSTMVRPRMLWRISLLHVCHCREHAACLV